MSEPRRSETHHLRRRVTRPLNSRAAVLANAEAVFTMSKSAAETRVKAPKPLLTGWPVPDAIKVAVWPRSINSIGDKKASLTDPIASNPEVHFGRF